MTHKLNINLVAEQKKPERTGPPPLGGPIGWWIVTTEGDEEGRSTDTLGTAFGHVADVAFHFADRQFYKLTMRKDVNRIPLAKAEPLTVKETKRNVFVTIASYDHTGVPSSKNPSEWAKWMDIDGVKVDTGNFYDSVCLTLDPKAVAETRVVTEQDAIRAAIKYMDDQRAGVRMSASDKSELYDKLLRARRNHP